MLLFCKRGSNREEAKEAERSSVEVIETNGEIGRAVNNLGDPLAPTNVATLKYQIWVSLFPGGNFLAKFSYKFLHRWSCTQTAQIALEYYSHTMGVWKSIY